MRRVLSLSLILLTASWLAAGSAAAQEAIVSPPKGDPLRLALLDAARLTFEREVGAPVEFVVHTLNVSDGWAFGSVRLQRPGGAPIDWRRTKFADAVAQGIFEADISFFLLRDPGDGWHLVEYAIGPTDVAWDWWRQQHNLPYELFGHTAQDLGAAPAAGKPRSGN